MLRMDIRQFIALICVGFAAALILGIFLSEAPDRQIEQATPKTSPEIPVATENIPCGRVSESCEVALTLRSEACAAEEAAEIAEISLADPMQFNECKSITQALNDKCPEDCSLVETSKLVIPGEVVVSELAPPDDSGLCAISASRKVSVQGDCLREGP